MENNSICKFNLNRSSDLICENFIYETDNTQATPRRAERHTIALAAEGTGVLTCGGRTYALSAGTLFFLTAGEQFSVASQDGLKYFYINFYGRRGDELMERFDIGQHNCIFEGYGELTSFWADCQSRAEEGNIDILCEAVLLYSLAGLRPMSKAPNDVITAIVTMTQEHFTNPNLSLAAMADELGYDAKYLSSLFKKKKGIAFTHYLRELRIRHAVFLMEEGIVSVKNIAWLSGFHDALYFSKVFTKCEGISPTAYIAAIAARGEKE